MSDSYCYTCKMEVLQCWDSDSGCSGGGHCVECGGYDFISPEEKEKEAMIAAMEEADRVLVKTLADKDE